MAVFTGASAKQASQVALFASPSQTTNVPAYSDDPHVPHVSEERKRMISGAAAIELTIGTSVAIHNPLSAGSPPGIYKVVPIRP